MNIWSLSGGGLASLYSRLGVETGHPPNVGSVRNQRHWPAKIAAAILSDRFGEAAPQRRGCPDRRQRAGRYCLNGMTFEPPLAKATAPSLRMVLIASSNAA
jgi:hypothetical protein